MGVYGGPYGVMGGYPADTPHGYANHMDPGHVQPSPHNSHPLLAPKPPSFDFQGRPHHPHAPPYGIGPPHPAAGGFDFNNPYSAQPMPPAPSVISSSSSSQPFEHNNHPMTAPPWDGYHRRDNEAPQYRVNQGLPATPGLESRDRVIAAAYDPDIDIDGASGEEMDSGSDGDEDLDGTDQRDELVRTRKLNGLVDGRAIAHHEVDETRMRTFSAYAEGHTLTSYIPTATQSGLTDPQTLAVFRHFIYVTGPSMSLYERHPFDHSKVSPDIPIPQSGQNIWTCKWALPIPSRPLRVRAPGIQVC